MPDATPDLARLSAARDAALSGRRCAVAPRLVIGESWHRMLRRGVDPELDTRSGLLPLEEIEHRRNSSPLAEVLPLLRDALVTVADAARHIMVIADADGYLLWREGHPTVLRRADSLGLDVGGSWAENRVGTNGIGTPLVTRRPVQVFSAEHFARVHLPWTCAGAPIRDPRDGRLLGVLDVSGPLSSVHPANLTLVTSVARLAEGELRHRHLEAIERLRSIAAPILCRTGGRALAIDAHGWPAAVTGMPTPERLALTKSFGAGRIWLPSLGMCSVEPLPGGWLVQVEEESLDAVTSRVVLDLSRPRQWTATVTGPAGSWTQDLSPRHAELLYVLALRPEGSTAAELATAVFGDATRAVTVRAEMSRIRRNLAGVLAHRPYRFGDEVAVEVTAPDRPGDLLPYSVAPAVRAARSGAS